jgi:hypothetical protein
MNENIFECFAEQLIGYIDARLAGDLETAMKIKKKLIKTNNVAESYKCHICKSVDNTGEIKIDIDGKLIWECKRCINNEFVIKNTLFSRNIRKENG